MLSGVQFAGRTDRMLTPASFLYLIVHLECIGAVEVRDTQAEECSGPEVPRKESDDPQPLAFPHLAQLCLGKNAKQLAPPNPPADKATATDRSVITYRSPRLLELFLSTTLRQPSHPSSTRVAHHNTYISKYCFDSDSPQSYELQT